MTEADPLLDRAAIQDAFRRLGDRLVRRGVVDDISGLVAGARRKFWPCVPPSSRMSPSLTGLIAAHPAGSTLTVTIIRNGQSRPVKVGTKESGGRPVMGVKIGAQFKFPFQVRISVGDIGGGGAGGMRAGGGVLARTPPP